MGYAHVDEEAFLFAAENAEGVTGLAQDLSCEGIAVFGGSSRRGSQYKGEVDFFSAIRSGKALDECCDLVLGRFGNGTLGEDVFANGKGEFVFGSGFVIPVLDIINGGLNGITADIDDAD